MNNLPIPHSGNRSAARVAITGVSGDVGLGAISGLRAGHIPCWILGLDINADCAGFHLCDAHQQVRKVIDPGYIGQLKEVLVEHDIQLLLCGVDSEVPLLAQWRPFLEQNTGCRVVVGNEQMVRRLADKLDANCWLEQLGLDPPRTWACTPDASVEEFALRLPLIAKPRHGNASQGLQMLDTVTGLAQFLRSQPVDYCLQEYLEGPEYTCGLLFDSTGTLRDWMSARRELANGRTMFAEVADNPRLDAFIQHFASRVPIQGPVNLQLKIAQDGHPKVFEVNPRLSGSTSMRVAVGFNDPARIVAHWLFGEPIARASVRRARIYRYLTELVMPCEKDGAS